MATEKYQLIYADPPWQFKNKKTGGSMKSGADHQYPTMTMDELKALDVQSLCDDNCVLIMWYVSSQPQEALDLVKAWGFTIKNMNGFIWRKLTANLMAFFGMGFWSRSGAECALIATRGKPKAACKSVRQVRDEPIEEHSKKPDVFRIDAVKLVCDVKRLEMFARSEYQGWHVFGNEVPGSIVISERGEV